MVTVNHNYLKLPGSYLFSTIGKKVRAYKEENPDKEVISLGIGDVTQPLVPAIIDALHGAVEEMAHAETKVLKRQEKWIPMLWLAVPESILGFVKILTV